MKKEELFKTLSELSIAQEVWGKLHTHIEDFFKVPRCKKGIIEFIDSVFSPESYQLSGYDEFKLGLISGKTAKNSWDGTRYIFDLEETKALHKNLTSKQKQFYTEMRNYIRWVFDELSKAELTDWAERQVYLRRAVARFEGNAFSSDNPVNKEQWADVPPCERIDYLSDSIDEVLNAVFDDKKIDELGSPRFGWGCVDTPNQIKSAKSFVEYIDSYLVY